MIFSKIYQPYINLKQGSSTWHAARKHHMGASEFASAVDSVGAYMSRRMLYKKKLGFVKECSNIAMEYGKDHEPDAAEEFGRLFGRLDILGMVLYDEDPFLACSPDGIWVDETDLGDSRLPNWDLDDRRWLVEFKCPFNGVHYSDIPPHHQVQILGQMAICGIHKCLYCSWSPYPKSNLQVWAVQFDLKKWNEVKQRIDEFVKEHLGVNREPVTKRGNKYSCELNRQKVINGIAQDSKILHDDNWDPVDADVGDWKN